MDYDVEEGTIPRDFIEYDFAEDALDFEVSFNATFITFTLPINFYITKFSLL